jgi:F0F1-type ATP synthase assembly protein I
LGDLNNIETYIKVFVAIIGAIATFGKLRENFASIKRKQELKLDLEILERLKSNEKFESSEIEEKINSKLKKAFEDRTENLTNFFVGIAVFVGFGFWTVDIFRNSERFNGWIILTLFCCLIGLTLIINSDNKKENKGVFYQIAFYDKEGFRFGIVFTLLMGILTGILIWKINGFSFWQFLSGLFFVIGIGSLMKNIKRIKNCG